jgi:hypothetical protein
VAFSPKIITFIIQVGSRNKAPISSNISPNSTEINFPFISLFKIFSPKKVCKTIELVINSHYLMIEIGV